MFEQSTFLKRKRSEKAFSLLDVMGAVMVVALFFAGVFLSNSRALTMQRAAKEAMNASKVLQERLEQLRTANWTELTDATYLQDLYSTGTHAGDMLPADSETVVISQYPPPVPASNANLLQVNRASNGTVTLTPYTAKAGAVLPDDLTDQTMVRVDVRVTWVSVLGRTRVRECSTIVANGGIGR